MRSQQLDDDPDPVTSEPAEDADELTGTHALAPALAEQQRYTSLELLMSVHRYITLGTVTGTTYCFYGAGSIQIVDGRDAPEMLARRRQSGGCCGHGPADEPVFRESA